MKVKRVPEYSKEFRARFWERVDKSGECWEWTWSIGGPGYGQIVNRKICLQPMTTHRVAWELHNGPIPKGMHVCHHCDNRKCVRPSHLFLGSHKDNMKDRDRKGRVASGNRNGARTKPWTNPFVRNGGSGLRGEK